MTTGPLFFHGIAKVIFSVLFSSFHFNKLSLRELGFCHHFFELVSCDLAHMGVEHPYKTDILKPQISILFDSFVSVPFEEIEARKNQLKSNALCYFMKLREAPLPLARWNVPGTGSDWS